LSISDDPFLSQYWYQLLFSSPLETGLPRDHPFQGTKFELMKVRPTLLRALAVIATVSVSTVAHAATVIHAVGVDNQSTSSSTFITSWGALGVDGNGATESLTGINGSVGTENFTYDITVAAVGYVGNLDESGNNNLLGKGSGALDGFGTGQGFDLTISNISNPNVQFDGFVQLSYGNVGNSEGAIINGTTYTRVPDGLSPSLSPVETASTLEWRSIDNNDGGTNGVTGRYIDFQFSNVPEPGSVALVGLGCLVLIFRRHRA
jgi:hypothetical protein